MTLREYIKIHWPSLVIIIALGTVCIIGVGVGLNRVISPPPPPLNYTQKLYDPESRVYAPGERMYFSPALGVASTGAVRAIRGVRNTDTHAWARTCSGERTKVVDEIWPPYDESDLGADLTGRTYYEVEDLPAGRYKYITAVYSLDSSGGKALYSVYFVVAKPCDV